MNDISPDIASLAIHFKVGESGRPQIQIGDAVEIPQMNPADARALAATVEQCAANAEIAAVTRHVLIECGLSEDQVGSVLRAVSATVNDLRADGYDGFPWRPVPEGHGI